MKLTPFLIEKIMEIGVDIIYIDDDISNDVLIEESLSDKSFDISF